MATPSIEDLVKPTTAEEVESTILSVATTLGLQVTAWQPFGVARTLIKIFAQKVADLSSFASEIAKSGFLDLCPDAWLPLVAFYVYGVKKTEATFASGSITFTNTSATNYPVTAGDIRVAHATTGKTYINNEDFTIPAQGSITTQILAEEAGAASSAGAGEITKMVTTYLGVTCSNANPVLGADAESRADLIKRCKAKLGALSPNGPKAIYDYIATSIAVGPPPTGVSAPINRTLTVVDATTGFVTVYLANANGPVTNDDVTAVNTAIQAQAVPVGVTATPASAAAKAIAITADVHIAGATQSDADIKTKISRVLGDYFKTIPIGGIKLAGQASGKVFVNALEGVIRAADSKIVQVVVTLPTGDTTLLSSEVATVGTTTLNIYRL